MSGLKTRLKALEMQKPTKPRLFKIIRARFDLPEVEARALLEIEANALEAEGFDVVCTIPAEWSIKHDVIM